MHATMSPSGHVPAPRTSRNRLWWLLTVVAALLLGLVVGFYWWAGSEGQPAVVTPNGVELTERQIQMVDVAKQYVAAWQANDGDAAASFMTPGATFSHHDLSDVYTAADRSLQTLVSETTAYASMQLDEPMLVDGDHLVLEGGIASMNLEFLSVIDFTNDDDPLIESEVVFFTS